MRTRSWRAVIAGVGSALLLAGCAPADLPLIGPSAQDLASGAASSVDGAAAVTLKGTVVVARVAYTVDVTVAPHRGGAIAGSGTYRKAPFQVVAGGGRAYLKGAAFWALVPDTAANDITRWPGFGSGWVVAGADDAAAGALSRLNDLGGLVERLGADAKTAKRAAQTTRKGTAVIPVTDRNVTYFVTAARPYRLRALESRDSGAGIQALSLDIGQAAPLDAKAPPPGPIVDPRDPATLPALYLLVGFGGLDACDAGSCGFGATVENTTGPAQGQTIATLELLQLDGGAAIGSCDVPVPALAHNQTTGVACRISGPGYAAFYNGIPPGGSAQVAPSVSFRNPPYS